MTSVQKRSRRGEEAEHEIKWKEKKLSRPDVLLVMLFFFKFQIGRVQNSKQNLYN